MLFAKGIVEEWTLEKINDTLRTADWICRIRHAVYEEANTEVYDDDVMIEAKKV